MDYNTLLYEVKDHVGTITLNRPEQKNALNAELLSELFGLLQDIRRNEDIKILIITGKGNAFAAGADIKMFAGVKEAFEARSISIVNNPIHELPRLDIPVVAAVNGPALGGGCELALACDQCLASEKALFGQPEINLGLIPGSGGTQRLPRLIGVRRAMELLFTGDTINAEEAYRIGLVNKVVPSDSLLAEAQKLANKLAGKPSVALRVIKTLVRTGLQTDMGTALNLEAEGFGLVFSSEDAKEGIQAFLEKRKPFYKGR